MEKNNAKKTAAELNAFLASFKGHQMSPAFNAKFGGTDAITGARFPAGISIRMLCGVPLLRAPYCGGAGVEVLDLAERVAHGTFVDDVDGDGTYYVVNATGKEVKFTVTGDQVYAYANYGTKCSLVAYRARKLRHAIALIKVEVR